MPRQIIHRAFPRQRWLDLVAFALLMWQLDGLPLRKNRREFPVPADRPHRITYRKLRRG